MHEVSEDHEVFRMIIHIFDLALKETSSNRYKSRYESTSCKNSKNVRKLFD